MGGPRYEQLFRATGSVQVADDQHAFSAAACASGARASAGSRASGATAGSRRCFPADGRSATSRTRRGPTGSPPSTRATCSTATASLIPARAVEAPWLTRLQPLGEDVSVVLETDRGTVRIEGETVVSTHDITDPSEIPAEMLEKMANWTFPALQQAGVRYRWDGEEAIGMLERSSPMDQITRQGRPGTCSTARTRWRAAGWSACSRGWGRRRSSRRRSSAGSRRSSVLNAIVQVIHQRSFQSVGFMIQHCAAR